MISCGRAAIWMPMSSIIDVSIVHYPESDGKPMGETDLHRNAMVCHIETLRYCFRGQRAYVSGDLLVYFEQGNPKKFVVPDTFVVFGIEPYPRRVYKIWVEGKAPDVVIETTSKKTRRKDTLEKPAIFAQIGIKEYFLYDPTQEYLDPPLQGYRLVNGKYEPIVPDQDGFLVSEVLGLRLKIEGDHLAFYRLDTGERLLSDAERAEQEAELAARQSARAERAEQEAARAEQEAERAKQEAKRAEQEAERARQVAEQARQETERADLEAAARRAAEAEVERLRAELRRRDERSPS